MNQFANGSDLGESLGTNGGYSETSDILLMMKTKGRTQWRARGARCRLVGREKSGGKSRGVRGRRIDEGRKMATTRKDRARIDAHAA